MSSGKAAGPNRETHFAFRAAEVGAVGNHAEAVCHRAQPPG